MRISDWSSDVCSSDLIHFLPRPAGAVLAGGAVGGAFVAGVAASAVAAAKHDDALARPGEIGKHSLLVVGQDLRADRHLDHQILAARAGAVRSSAAIASLRTEMLGVAKVDQRVQPRDRFKDDIAALAAVAAVRAAIFDELLAAEGHGTGAARAGRSEEHTSELQSLMRISYA